MKTYKYLHKAHYYETDKMGIIHHSNYIRWFEEARVAFLDEIGFSYARIENKLKLISPVLEIGCQYKRMMRFEDVAELIVGVESTNGIRLRLSYQVRDAKTKELCATGFSLHCFLNQQGSFVSLKKEAPELYTLLRDCSLSDD